MSSQLDLKGKVISNHYYDEFGNESDLKNRNRGPTMSGTVGSAGEVVEQPEYDSEEYWASLTPEERYYRKNISLLTVINTCGV